MDFSEKFIEVEDVDLSEYSRTITLIKNKYAYQGNLESFLNMLISRYIPLFHKEQQEQPRPATQRKLFLKISEQTKNLKESLEWLSPDMEEAMYTLIKNKTPNKNFYVLLNTTISRLKFLYPKFQAMADALFKKDEGGKQKGSLAKYLIEILVNNYEKDTGKTAVCAWNAMRGENGSYQGNVYDFILEINDTILKNFNLKLGTPKTIGKYVRDIILSMTSEES